MSFNISIPPTNKHDFSFAVRSVDSDTELNDDENNLLLSVKSAAVVISENFEDNFELQATLSGSVDKSGDTKNGFTMNTSSSINVTGNEIPVVEPPTPPAPASPPLSPSNPEFQEENP